jgi:HEAT repeat protein
MILSLQGAEKNELVHQYSLLGYLSEDRAQLRSPLWWRRLAAIVRISHLESTATQSDLVSSLTDTHRLVSQVAMESLSRFQTPFAAKCVLKQIAHQPPERDDLLTELFVGAARSTDMDEIFSVAAKSPEPRVKIAAVRAAGKLHSLEAVPRLIEMARSYVNDEELLVSVLVSLKEIGDPRATESTLRLLKNPSGRVRARAIEALSIYGDTNELADFENFQNDPSLEVRRVIHALKSRRAA